MARKGPKPKMGAKRRSATTRAQRQRVGDVVRPTDERIGKVGHYDFPIDGLLANRKVDEEQHQAGMEYHRLFVAVFGKPFADCGAIYRRVAGDFSQEYISGETDHDVRAERRYRIAADALKGLAGRAPYVVHKVTIRLQPPSPGELEHLLRGLEEMANALGYRSHKVTKAA